MIYGIIDMGANTIRMSIYRVDDQELTFLFHKKATAELCSYVSDGVLSPAGMEKACQALKKFRTTLDNLGIENYHVFATASLRNIANTQEAVSFIREQTGISVEVLSGEEEARLAFVGASRKTQASDGILVDIGGGSTEIVEFQDDLILSSVSLPIGCLTLYMNHVEDIFPRKEQYLKIRHDVRSLLNSTVTLRGTGSDILFGVGGTVRTVLKINNLLFDLPQNNREISYENLNQILKRFKKSDRTALKALLQIAPDRIHTLIPGLTVLKAVAKYCGSSRILVSSFGVREGYLHDRILGESPQ